MASGIKTSSGAALLVIALAGLAGCASSTTAASDAPAPVVTVTATATATATVAPSPSSTPKTAKPKPKAPAKPTVYEMPNEIGSVLQDAQEDIEGILNVPVWPLLRSHDVKDGWRFQVLDRDWKVCTQKPAVGSTFTDTTIIDFGVVKLDETCP